ncbi:MAG: hypothetical protein FWD71_05705 [Oscillospiraceae bacterium]|nr:hypothetical protein [Oscillospiraceae bacterium]
MYIDANRTDFFTWIEKNISLTVPDNITDRFRAGKIDKNDDNYFIEKTGKSIDDLWDMYLDANK